MSNIAMEVSSTWFQNPRSWPFWPGDESLSDGLRADSRRAGRQRAGACRGPISDVARLARSERLRPFCCDDLRAADLSRELSGHRGLFADAFRARLPHGHPR